MKTAVTQAAYQNIMAAAYAIGSYVPQSPLNCSANGRWPAWGQLPLWQQPNAYTVLDVDFKSCSAGASPVVQPFNTVGPAYIPYTYPTDPANPYVKDQRTSTIMADTVWLAISLQTSPYNSGPAGIYNPPASSLLSNLFTPLQQGGLGVYRPAFFEGWPFPRVTCDPSYGVYPPGWDGMSIGGCNWAAGQSSSPPPPPGPPTGITIRANQISKNQTQVNLLLSVFNSGTERANSIEITSITLRTLGGAGQATAVSPALPARVLNLAPGDSTDVPVTLNIPPTITKLGITEQGSINAAGPVLAQFSEGQVLYPR
jgi:hypothetical protein